MDMGNGFSFMNISKQNQLLGGQIYSLQHWKRNFDHDKESFRSVLPWVRLPKLQLELWNDSILGKLVKPIGNVYKDDTNSEEVMKVMFARVCKEFDISKPLKMEIKYIRNGIMYEYDS